MTPKIIERRKRDLIKAVAAKRGRGRPAVFDRGKALQEAMKLFWERG